MVSVDVKPNVSKDAQLVSRCGLAVSRYACSIRFGSRFSSDIVVYGHCLVTLPPKIDETLKCVPQLTALMQSHSSDDSVASRW